MPDRHQPADRRRHGQTRHLRRRRHPRQRDPGHRSVLLPGLGSSSAATGRTARSPPSSTRPASTSCPVVNVDSRSASSPTPSRRLRPPLCAYRPTTTGTGFRRGPPDDLDGDGASCTMRGGPLRRRTRPTPRTRASWSGSSRASRASGRCSARRASTTTATARSTRTATATSTPTATGASLGPAVRPGRLRAISLPGVALKALAEWTITETQHRFAWSFHNYGGMFLRGPEPQRARRVPAAGRRGLRLLGKQGERIIPGYRYMISWKDLYTTPGDFDEWMSQFLGAYFYCAEVFQGESEAFRGVTERPRRATPRRAERDTSRRASPTASGSSSTTTTARASCSSPGSPSAPRVRRRRDRRLGKISRVWRPYMIPDLVHRNAMAVVFSAKHTPEVSLEVIEVKTWGGDLYRVRVRLANRKAMPTMSYWRRSQVVSQGHAQGLRAPGPRSSPAAFSSIPTSIGRLQKGQAGASVLWSSPDSARSTISSWSKGKGEITLRVRIPARRQADEKRSSSRVGADWRAGPFGGRIAGEYPR